MLKIAVQKSDRISKGFLDLLQKCGLSGGDKSKLYCKIEGLPIEIYFVRGSDIPALIANKFDVCVIGKDSFLEYELTNVGEIKQTLGFAKCRLCIAGSSREIVWGNGVKIATSYPNILSDFLTKQNLKADIVRMNGSVESSIKLGIADYICDIVQTGSTLIENNLYEIAEVKKLEAVLIATNNYSNSILQTLLTRINAVINATQSKYLMFNVKKENLSDVLNCLPSSKSPTVIPLALNTHYAVHTICNSDSIWGVVESISNLGGEDVLVSDINLKF